MKTTQPSSPIFQVFSFIFSFFNDSPISPVLPFLPCCYWKRGRGDGKKEKKKTENLQHWHFHVLVFRDILCKKKMLKLVMKCVSHLLPSSVWNLLRGLLEKQAGFPPAHVFHLIRFSSNSFPWGRGGEGRGAAWGSFSFTLSFTRGSRFYSLYDSTGLTQVQNKHR